MKIIFMGTPDFAIPSLTHLAQYHQIQCVVSQPDRRQGRGQQFAAPPVKEWAIENNIPVYQPETLKDNAFLPVLQQYDPDVIVVAAYGKILPQYILDYPKYGCINVHASLLPKYRGAAPIQHAVLNGDAETGITIMQMAAGMDTGDILLQESTLIGIYETSGQLFDRLSELGAKTLLRVLQLMESDALHPVAQNEAMATYAPMISKDMAKIDFSLSAEEILQKVLGFNPWPLAFFEAEQGILKLYDVSLGEETVAEIGEIVAIDKQLGIGVCCGDHRVIWLQMVQKAGKKVMDGYSFAMGARLEKGQKL